MTRGGQQRANGQRPRRLLALQERFGNDSDSFQARLIGQSVLSQIRLQITSSMTPHQLSTASRRSRKLSRQALLPEVSVSD